MDFFGEQHREFSVFRVFNLILDKLEVAVQYILPRRIFRKEKENNYFRIIILDR